MKFYLAQLTAFLIFLGVLQITFNGTWKVRNITDLGGTYVVIICMFLIVCYFGFFNTMDRKWKITWQVLVLGPIVALLLALAFVDVENSPFWSPENF